MRVIEIDDHTTLTDEEEQWFDNFMSDSVQDEITTFGPYGFWPLKFRVMIRDVSSYNGDTNWKVSLDKQKNGKFYGILSISLKDDGEFTARLGLLSDDPVTVTDKEAND